MIALLADWSWTDATEQRREQRKRADRRVAKGKVSKGSSNVAKD